MILSKWLNYETFELAGFLIPICAFNFHFRQLINFVVLRVSSPNIIINNYKIFGLKYSTQIYLAHNRNGSVTTLILTKTEINSRPQGSIK